jgi:hypothetical protein
LSQLASSNNVSVNLDEPIPEKAELEMDRELIADFLDTAKEV